MANEIFRHYIFNRADVVRDIEAGIPVLRAYDNAICANPVNDWHYNHAGYMGDLWEFGCSFYLNDGAIIRKAIRSAFSDTKVGNYRFEIKSACGELPEGNKWHYVIYTAEVDLDADPLEVGAVFNREEWDEFLGGYPGRGAFLVERWDSKHLFRKSHIQSFRSAGRPKASKPIREYIDTVCESMMTLGEFLEG